MLAVEGEIYSVFFEVANSGKTYYLKDGDYRLVTWNWTNLKNYRNFKPAGFQTMVFPTI